MKLSRTGYSALLNNIGASIETGRNNAVSMLNSQVLLTYWQIGQYIVEFEQEGKDRALYGDALFTNLSKDLRSSHGKGFSKSNLYMMRLFYQKYPKFQTSGKSSKGSKFQTSGILSWSHYNELLSVSDDIARAFYEKQCIKENCSVRELKRQISSALFQRIAVSKDKKGILALAKKGHDAASVQDLVKDPYVFEFLKLPEGRLVTEKGLEKKLIDNLQAFLLELGKGFSFIARQFRISIGNKHFRIDLVFYHGY